MRGKKRHRKKAEKKRREAEEKSWRELGEFLQLDVSKLSPLEREMVLAHQWLVDNVIRSLFYGLGRGFEIKEKT